ncbi:hypothetical protein P152DRAFT_93067 [Eremomyces bilateralis CBS 781.70]|uniref:Uncharacterized protein n=1 Tax=Eremomyces bilateralis CBS 781.70 TaxID=1392243 RepID=A0A6G1FYA4_9PEZI|nr:uncharacterized protein P152DRAFT_93067 [Eremomyces bilateralis CBS 781.70]KAF1810671.1 hypothetical protein P152DRAFT_93067 [Eremomyces bilateralis CBS 781.70]
MRLMCVSVGEKLNRGNSKRSMNGFGRRSTNTTLESRMTMDDSLLVASGTNRDQPTQKDASPVQEKDVPKGWGGPQSLGIYTYAPQLLPQSIPRPHSLPGLSYDHRSDWRRSIEQARNLLQKQVEEMAAAAEEGERAILAEKEGEYNRGLDTPDTTVPALAPQAGPHPPEEPDIPESELCKYCDLPREAHEPPKPTTATLINPTGPRTPSAPHSLPHHPTTYHPSYNSISIPLPALEELGSMVDAGLEKLGEGLAHVHALARQDIELRGVTEGVAGEIAEGQGRRRLWQLTECGARGKGEWVVEREMGKEVEREMGRKAWGKGFGKGGFEELVTDHRC